MYDGNPDTDWHTSGYNQQLGPGGISSATGGVLTLERAATLREVVINSPSGGARVEIHKVEGAPSPSADTLIGSGKLEAGRTPIQIEMTGKTEKILIVFTQLVPGPDGRFSSQINEVTVTG
ncbi:hypothetical protein ACFQ0O_38095 [Saccharopolyspora spinosporotrichia]